MSALDQLNVEATPEATTEATSEVTTEATATPTTPEAFYAGFEDADLKGYTENKGFKSVEALAKSYRELESWRGEKRLKMPSEDNAEEWNNLYNELGRPENPEDYQIDLPENDNGDYLKHAQGWMHEAGLSSKQAQLLAEKHNEYQIELQKAQDEALNEQTQVEIDEVKQEWGAAHSRNLEIAKRGAEQFGIDENKMARLIETFGFRETANLMLAIGKGLTEAPRVGFEQGSGALSPDGARAKIQELTSDREWADRYISGGVKERNEMERLQKLAAM